MATILGITGGIGCGKSVVSRILTTMGVPVYDADFNAKQLYVTDLDLRNKLSSIVGKDVFPNDGSFDRHLMASRIFADRSLLQRVNALVHPAVARDFEHWVSTQEGRCVVGVESAILLQIGGILRCNRVAVVVASKDVRIRRTMARDGASREEVERRIASQMSVEEMMCGADFVIKNDDSCSLVEQVIHLYDAMMAFC